MTRFITQPAPWSQRNTGDRIPHSNKVDPKEPARAEILILLHRMELAGLKIDDRAVEIAHALCRHRRTEVERVEQVKPPLAPGYDVSGRKSWVYYVRCGYLIKIGTTFNLGSRFQSVRPNELLALEHGTHVLETARHREFKPLNAGGDYFHPGPALQAHIKELRDRLGPPDWPGSVLKDGHDFFPDNQVDG